MPGIPAETTRVGWKLAAIDHDSRLHMTGMTEEPSGAGLGAGRDDATTVASDAPGNKPAALTISQTALVEPIIIPNSLWRSTDPLAYNGAQECEITHLAALETDPAMRRDDARWSGALEVIPTKADVVLDLIRANSLWPLSGLACCAMDMMSAAMSKHDMDRWGCSRSGLRRARPTS
jgi:hypothetical protein